MVAVFPKKKISGHKLKNGLTHAKSNGGIPKQPQVGTETAVKDKAHFQPPVVLNPYMEDIVTDNNFLTGPTGSYVVSLGAAEDLLQVMD
ncbi:hypothetical protein V8B97DRAFT_2005368 [Scleroderma yunnanense]